MHDVDANDADDEVIAEPPLEIAWGGSKRRRGHRDGRIAHADGDSTRLKPLTGTASGDDVGGAAGRWKRRNVARELRYEVDLGSNRTTRLPWDCLRVERGRNASRQMLEHLTLEAVMIGRVTRASRNIGSIAGVLVSRR